MANRRAIGFFALASVLFGTTFVAAKAGLSYFPPLLFVAMRFDLAALVLLGYVLVTTDREDLVPRTRGDLVGILATGGLVVGLTNAFLFVGQQYVTSGVASIVFSLNPIMTPVFAAALLADERVSRRGLVGMAIGLVGVGLVVSPDPANLLGGGVLGKALIFAGVTAGALGSVLIRWGDGTLSSSVRTAWGLPVAALVSHALSLGVGESASEIVWTPTAVAALVYVAVFAGAIAYIAYFGLIDAVGPIRANLINYVVPVVATLGGWALLGETISALTIGGFLTIVAGFAVLGSEEIDLPALRTRLPSPVAGSWFDPTTRGSLRTDGGSTDSKLQDDGRCYECD